MQYATRCVGVSQQYLETRIAPLKMSSIMTICVDHCIANLADCLVVDNITKPLVEVKPSTTPWRRTQGNARSFYYMWGRRLTNHLQAFISVTASTFWPHLQSTLGPCVCRHSHLNLEKLEHTYLPFPVHYTTKPYIWSKSGVDVCKEESVKI